MENKDPRNKKNTLPEGTVYTMLKFQRSERDNNTLIGFVSQDVKTQQVYGRTLDDHYPKKIVLADAKLNGMLLPGVLYRCTLVPMRHKKGYIAIKATPHQFKATIAVNYVPKALYQLTVSFGNMQMIYDPKDGQKQSVKCLNAFMTELSKRLDIENIGMVVQDVERQAVILLEFLKKDGFYVSEVHKAV